ncbi:Slam-dependent surface lipoprotein [Stutzerimonas kirkiae]|uniref:Slam-dependent surface lipoprotein n=1 Tax=Stutzerimonas kirkiae TaxID=2211392 RepID=UPI0010385255|nr:Slam-dependent surface lipoprotein [Stutzerimonas kirkiae]TBV08040.1 hypothetical protein DNK08_11710 [Stutzerimonas kirkiae]TBV15813.1 hypothetical protein DNK01_05835 [Stutzerimonas kirkiae]
MKAFSYSKRIIALLAISGSANAAIVGDESYNASIEVGPATFVDGLPPMSGPGIGVSTSYTSLVQKASFSTLQTLGSTTNITAGPISKLTTLTPVGSPYSIGYFNFAQISGQDVFFGEWTNNNNVVTGNHAVYYIGRDGDTSITKTGVVKYDVRGISNYQTYGLLSGEFSADFGSKTLTGYMYTPTYNYAINIGSAKINNDASISPGTTKAYAYVNGQVVGYDGLVNGHFFNNQESLAGYIRFPSAPNNLRQYDTAFGGTIK